MKEYFRYFKWLYVILGLLLLILLILNAGQWGIARAVDYQRTNQQCMTEERVFDYGYVLSGKEEAKLRKLIAKREKQSGCDIVIITLT